MALKKKKKMNNVWAPLIGPATGSYSSSNITITPSTAATTSTNVYIGSPLTASGPCGTTLTNNWTTGYHYVEPTCAVCDEKMTSMDRVFCATCKKAILAFRSFILSGDDDSAQETEDTCQ